MIKLHSIEINQRYPYHYPILFISWFSEELLFTCFTIRNDF